MGKDFSSPSCHSKPLLHLLGLAEVLCHLPHKTKVESDTRICEKGRFCWGHLGLTLVVLIWNRAFLGTQKSCCRWICVFYTHSSQNAVPKSTTWGLPDFSVRSQRVYIFGFVGREATCSLCHSHGTDVVCKWPETLGQWVKAAVFTGVRNRWRDIDPSLITVMKSALSLS